METADKLKEFKQELSKINTNVWKNKNYEDYHVVKIDKNLKVVDVFKNRNQVIRHVFRKYSKQRIVREYLKWNGALLLVMKEGKIFKNYYYKYVDKDEYPVTIAFKENPNWNPKPVIAVDDKGNEIEFNSVTECKNTLNENIHTYHLNSGKIVNGLSFYTKDHLMLFNSKKEAIKFYRIGKDKFKKLYSNGSKIRGQIVKFYTYND
jgi:hypothetical protein